MAINATTVWEVRTTGAQTNGGGFYNLNPGTSVDYSQQDAAQLALTDIAVTTTALVSATGGFTAAMTGNIIYLSGATPGWYQIVAVVDTNNATIDRTAGTATGVTGNVGGAWLMGGSLDGEFAAMVVGGNTVHAKTGTYTLGEAITWDIAAVAAPIRIIGYNATRGDTPTLANRPTIACGSYIWSTSGYHQVSNFIFTGTASSVVNSNVFCIYRNCKCTNSSATANRYAFLDNSNSPSRFVQCEGISTAGRAFGSTGTSASTFAFCYAHDSVIGFYGTGAHGGVLNSIVDTCSTYGIQSTAGWVITNNVIYGCGTGILLASQAGQVIVNNIFAGNTVGASTTTAGLIVLLDHNCWNNTTDVNNLTKGANAVTADPLLNAPATGDFTLKTGSPCLDAGMQPDATIGLA